MTRDRDDSRSSRDDDRGRDRGRDDDRGSRDRGRDRDDDRGGRGVRDGRRSFTYQARDPDEAKRRAEQSGGDFDVYINRDVKTFKPAIGANTIRILPPTWDRPKHYGTDIWVHYGIGPDEQAYLCLNKMKNEPCPICEERQEANRSGDEKYAKELSPTRRVLVYLIDRDHEKEGLQAWAMPQTLDQDFVKISRDKRTNEVLPIDHPDNGYDIDFDKTGAKRNTKYDGITVARRDSPLDNDAALDYALDHPLPTQLVYYDYEHIKSVFGGGGRPSAGRSDDRDAGRGDDSRSSRESRGREDSRDSGNDRDRGRDNDRGGDRGRDRSRGDDRPTWESVHEMKGRELEDLIDAEKLDINPQEAKDDEDLADWVCEELKLKKAEPAARSRTRVTATDDKGDDKANSVDDRLRRMRESRRD